MVKCSNCGVEVADSFDLCPNCGRNLNKSIESTNESNNASNSKCESCGSDLPDNVLFCPTCGLKLNEDVSKSEEKSAHFCPNCGQTLEDGVVFCPECGADITSGEIKQNIQYNDNRSFFEKINLGYIVLPTVVALIIVIILSLIGLFIGFSWLSFIIAMILGVGFFGGTINNESNATISGLIVGLILGLVEIPLVQFVFGAFLAGFYKGFFGGQLLTLLIIGAVMGYVSNMYLKDTIQGIAVKIGIPWI